MVLLQRWHGRQKTHVEQFCDGFPSDAWIRQVQADGGPCISMSDPTAESLSELASQVRNWHFHLQAAVTPAIEESMANAVQTLEVGLWEEQKDVSKY